MPTCVWTQEFKNTEQSCSTHSGVADKDRQCTRLHKGKCFMLLFAKRTIGHTRCTLRLVDKDRQCTHLHKRESFMLLFAQRTIENTQGARPHPTRTTALIRATQSNYQQANTKNTRVREAVSRLLTFPVTREMSARAITSA